jgi:hypothetical protein
MAHQARKGDLRPEGQVESGFQRSLAYPNAMAGQPGRLAPESASFGVID